MPWGPWSISEVWSGDVHVGWGANCCRHRNSWEGNPCKRSFRWAGYTEEQTRCQAKQWLLMGVGIRSQLRNGKQKHLSDIKREDIPLLPEAELDARAAALL